MSACKRFVGKVWSDFVQMKGHDGTSFGHLKVIDAKPGFVKATMKVESHQVNRLKSLHGGVTSSLVDTMGSLALSSHGMWLTGVSTDIHVTFVRAALLGETIGLESEVVGRGKTLAYTRVNIKNIESGKLLAFGSHTKYIASALKCADNVNFDQDGELKEQ